MNVDFLIIGQGMAGSTLAIELLRRGKSVLVIDRQNGQSSTRVAAGLITPLTGKGMNPAWRQEKYLSTAITFYHELEKESGRKLYHKTPVVRLFSTRSEQEKWRRKALEHGQWAYEMARIEGPFKPTHGGIEMPDGAWLDTVSFLQVVRDRLTDAGAFRQATFSETDVTLDATGVQWQDVHAGKIILCQGAYGLAGVDGYQGWFSGIPHRCAKGEILSLRVGGLDQTKRYHCNGWLAPRKNNTWKAGATYDWKNLDSTPTSPGKAEVLEKLRTWLDERNVPIEVIGHEAGIRPIIRNSRPLAGFHPDTPQIGFFNGLGSKGTLMAPGTARHFAKHLCGQCQLDENLSLPTLQA